MRWHLPASSGRNELSGEFFAQRLDDSGRHVVFSRIELKGAFWPRFSNDPGSKETPDYSVTLHQVVLRREQLDLLIRRLAEWMRAPLALSVEVAKTTGNDQSFEISIGQVDGLMSTADRPACTVRYSSGAFAHGTWSFIVDQSCIKVFLDELTDSLEVLSSS